MPNCFKMKFSNNTTKNPKAIAIPPIFAIGNLCIRLSLSGMSKTPAFSAILRTIGVAKKDTKNARDMDKIYCKYSGICITVSSYNFIAYESYASTFTTLIPASFNISIAISSGYSPLKTTFEIPAFISIFAQREHG